MNDIELRQALVEAQVKVAQLEQQNHKMFEASIALATALMEQATLHTSGIHQLIADLKAQRIL